MDIEDYQDRFAELIELEQAEEMRRHRREMNTLSGRERQRKGRCLLEMTVVDSEEGIRGENRITLRKSSGESLPELEISVGDLVQISRKEPLNENNPTATVWSKNGREIVLSTSGSLPNWAQRDGLRIDLYVDNVTYQRMLDALFLLNGLEHDQLPLREVLLTIREPKSADEKISEWSNNSLNKSQRQAVENSVGANILHLIHGPPGTGKTVTLTEVIYQGVKRGNRVLATAPSNVAVDNLVECLVGAGVDAVRLGHPARAHPSLREYTLDNRLKERPAFRKSDSKRREALDLIEQRRDLTAPTGQWRRGLDDDEIHHLASQGKGSRGLDPERIQQMSEYMKLSEKIDELFEESDRLEERAIDRLLQDVDVVCATNTGAGSDLLAGYKFDWICVDEATQATEPSCLIPLTKGTKLIMAGDHRQLPPTVLSDEALDRGFDQSLFERMMDNYGAACSNTLNVQYRMHHRIMDFPDATFYENGIEADSTVRSHTLGDFPGYHPESVSSRLRDTIRERPVIGWIDTTDASSGEKRREDSHSIYNPLEARWVTELVEGFRNAGLSPSDLAVISPYRAQVELLRDHRQDTNLEVDTVDGFQGREKEVVIISFVRSNQSGAIGFLADERRLNVSLTRAKRKLVLVGDRATLARHHPYDQLSQYVNENGQIFAVGNMEPQIEGQF